MLWSMENITRHKRSHGHPLHPGLAPDVLTLSCLWVQLGQDERLRLTARLSLTIIQFTVHVILISNTQSQHAHICKSYKSPVSMGERRSSRWGNTGSCSCGLAHRRLGSWVMGKDCTRSYKVARPHKKGSWWIRSKKNQQSRAETCTAESQS